MGPDPVRRAQELFEQAYQAQMRGELEQAVRLYEESIALHPTAEAHTFLGWTYSFQGALEAAIEECRKAIAVDPEFGNPYNDIGAYLVQLGRPDEAIPWLERATRAKRYEAPHFPHLNLGRVYLAKEMYSSALAAFQRAEALHSDPRTAEMIRAIRLRLN